MVDHRSGATGWWRDASGVVSSSVSVAGTGLVLAAAGLIPALLGGSLHSTLKGLYVAHWFLAGLMPFSVGAGASLALRRGPPDRVNGRGPAVRTLLIGALGALLSEGFFQTVGLYGGSQLTGDTTAAFRRGHPHPFTTGQFVTVVVLGVLAGALLARSQWRGVLRLRQPPPR